MQKNKTTHTKVETILFTLKEAESWEVPPFQRPLTINQKIHDVAQTIKDNGGIIPGVLTFGVVNRNSYLLDGQHRREGFKLSGLTEGYADTRTCYFDSMAEMGEEYVDLNSHLVNMKPDDVLRGLEAALPVLHRIRKSCPFVGYDMVRRNPDSPILSMSTLLRCWVSSASEVPGRSTPSSVTLARIFSQEDTDHVIRFLGLAYKALGKDKEYHRLWGALNLTMCMWLFRRIVLGAHSSQTKRISDEQFSKCMMALSADAVYVDWLAGRSTGERDRSPTYSRIRNIFSARLESDTGIKFRMPKPEWVH